MDPAHVSVLNDGHKPLIQKKILIYLLHCRKLFFRFHDLNGQGIAVSAFAWELYGTSYVTLALR